MKVLVANDLYGRSSAAGVAVAMAEGLAARGHAVAFLATTQDQAAARREQVGGVDVSVVPTPDYNKRWRAWRSLNNPVGVAAMRRAVGELRPDVVHVHNLHIHLSYAALSAASATGAKVVLHVHDVMPVCHQKMFCHLDERIVPGDVVRYRNGPIKCALCVRGRYNPFRNGTIRRVVRRHVTRLAAVSPEMARVMQDNGFGQATVIPNGLVPGRQTATPAEVTALAQRLGLTGRPVIFYGGRLDRLKGGLELVRALERVRRRVPRAVILTVGEALPGFAEEMAGLASRLGMADALVSAGWLSGSELAAAYALADVVATPSLCFESFGLVNLEAMAAGRPVVASLWGGPSDVVADGETGFLVNPLQIGTLADRLIRLLTDATLCERMGRAGQARVAQRFSVERQIDLTLEMYRDMGLDTGTSAA
jgi:glycosyltransferase involved in cell wall biosynthesis